MLKGQNGPVFQHQYEKKTEGKQLFCSLEPELNKRIFESEEIDFFALCNGKRIPHPNRA